MYATYVNFAELLAYPESRISCQFHRLHFVLVERTKIVQMTLNIYLCMRVFFDLNVEIN